MAFVVDTNVLMSYFLMQDSIPGQAAQKAMGAGNLLFTEATLGEFMAVLQRRKFDRYTTPALRKSFLRAIVAQADIVAVTRPIRACRDENDDKFLEAAVHGHTACLITGDKDLLVRHPFMGIPILTPTNFLKRRRGY